MMGKSDLRKKGLGLDTSRASRPGKEDEQRSQRAAKCLSRHVAMERTRRKGE